MKTGKCCWCGKTFYSTYLPYHNTNGECKGLPQLTRVLLRRGVNFKNAIFINDYLTHYGGEAFNQIINPLEEKIVGEYQRRGDKKMGDENGN